jgi:hypothetical protein
MVAATGNFDYMPDARREFPCMATRLAAKCSTWFYCELKKIVCCFVAENNC